MECHPGRAGLEATHVFQEIADAYHVLSDPELRRDYDDRLRRREETERLPAQPIVEGRRPGSEPLISEPISIIRDFSTVGPSLEALFDRFMRNFTGRRMPKAERTEGLTLEIVLTSEEASRGGSITFGVPMWHPCTSCGGSGREWPFACTHCQGQGILEVERPVTLRVPAGVQSGAIYEVSLRGLGIENLHLVVHFRIASGI